MKKIIILGLAILYLPGCASIVTGQDQTLSVDTPNCRGASCKLVNDDGAYYISSTPGTVMVNREYGDLTVVCSKKGFEDGIVTVSSKTKGMAFGNIIVGGIIGAAVDIGTGAAYDYPSEVVVPMSCNSEETIAKTSEQQNIEENIGEEALDNPGSELIGE